MARGPVAWATGICWLRRRAAWRAVRRNHCGAAKSAGARFTPKGGFNSIYLATDPVTALTEVSALVALPGGPAPIRAAPLVIVSVDGVVSRVLDLTDADTLAALGTNPQEITGTWVKVPNPPT